MDKEKKEETSSGLEEENIQEENQKTPQSKKGIDKIMVTISLVILIVLIIFSAYLFIFKGIKQGQEKEYINEQTGLLNINKDNVIENPTEDDIRGLIDQIKNQKESLGEEDEE